MSYHRDIRRQSGVGRSTESITSTSMGAVSVSRQEWGAFVTVLETNIVRRPVVDRTGLTGQFDITLEWNPDLARVPDIVVNAPTLAAG